LASLDDGLAGYSFAHLFASLSARSFASLFAYLASTMARTKTACKGYLLQ
jgi:hypothetical protein